MATRRVGKGFDMGKDAKTRVYNYIIPSRLFQPLEQFKNNNPIEGKDLEETI